MPSVVCLAHSDPRIAQVQRLRYDVYCLEREYLSPASFPDRRERDEYDPVAQHFGVFAHATAIATVRLVRDSAIGFPMERFVPRGALEDVGVRRHRTGEISRLIVRRDHRRGGTADGSRLLLGMFRAMYDEGRGCGIDQFIAALEPRFIRLLQRFGFRLAPIAPPIDWFGEVVACAVSAIPASFRMPRAECLTELEMA